MPEGRKRLEGAMRDLLGGKQDKPRLFPGALGAYVDGVKQLKVQGRPDFVYVRLRGATSEVIHAFNDAVGLHWDLPVLVYRDPLAKHLWRIYARDIGQYQDWGGASYLPPHGLSHSFVGGTGGGSDVVWVQKRQFMPLLGRPDTSGSMSVWVEPDYYYWDDLYHYWPGSGTSSLLGSKPTGTHTGRFVTVYLDGDTGILRTLNGVEFDIVYPPADPSLYIPALTGSVGIPIVAVFLTTGTDRIGWGELYDLRGVVSVPSTGAGSIPVPSTGTVVVEDEGIIQGSAPILDFVGAGVTAAVAGGVATVTIPGIDTTGTATYLRAGKPVPLDGPTGNYWIVADAQFATGSLGLSINGLWQTPVEDYVEQYAESGTFSVLPSLPTGSFLMCVWGVEGQLVATGAPLSSHYVLTEADGQLPNAVVLPRLAGDPDSPPPSPHAMDDEFNGTVLDPKWSPFNTTGTSIDLTSFPSHVIFTAPAFNGDKLRMIQQSIPAGAFTMTAKVAIARRGINYSAVGLFIRDSATNRVVTMYWDFNATVFTMGGTGVNLEYFTSHTVYNSRLGGTEFAGNHVYLRWVDDGVNFNWYLSADGRGWCHVISAGRTAWLANPNKVGLSWAVNNPNFDIQASVDWFRVTEP